MNTILYETNELRIEHEFEYALLIDKASGKALFEDDFYGDPYCGLIDINNNWAIVAGEHLSIWTPKKTKIFNHEDLRWIHSLRVKDNETVEILIDPWSENSSIWEINTQTFEIKKVRDFLDYKEKEYTENVIW
jgi:hypothetical protein